MLVRGDEIVEIHSLAADIERTFECCALEQIAHIVLEAAIHRKVILANLDGRLAKLQITGSKAKQRTLDHNIGHAIDLQLHTAQRDITLSRDAVVLLVIDIREATSNAHIGINNARERHILQRIDVLNLA